MLYKTHTLAYAHTDTDTHTEMHTHIHTHTRTHPHTQNTRTVLIFKRVRHAQPRWRKCVCALRTLLGCRRSESCSCTRRQRVPRVPVVARVEKILKSQHTTECNMSISYKAEFIKNLPAWRTKTCLVFFGLNPLTTLQHTATHCNTLQYTATHNTVLGLFWLPSTDHTATHCIILQHTAIHCDTLQYTMTCLVLLGRHPRTYSHTISHRDTLWV